MGRKLIRFHGQHLRYHSSSHTLTYACILQPRDVNTRVCSFPPVVCSWVDCLLNKALGHITVRKRIQRNTNIWTRTSELSKAFIKILVMNFDIPTVYTRKIKGILRAACKRLFYDQLVRFLLFFLAREYTVKPCHLSIVGRTSVGFYCNRKVKGSDETKEHGRILRRTFTSSLSKHPTQNPSIR